MFAEKKFFIDLWNINSLRKYCEYKASKHDEAMFTKA